MRVVRGVELGSDHHLVLMKVRLKVKKQKKGREVEWKTRWSDDFQWMYNCGMYLNNNSIILMSVLLPFVIKTTPRLGTCQIN